LGLLFLGSLREKVQMVESKEIKMERYCYWCGKNGIVVDEEMKILE